MAHARQGSQKSGGPPDFGFQSELDERLESLDIDVVMLFLLRVPMACGIAGQLSQLVVSLAHLLFIYHQHHAEFEKNLNKQYFFRHGKPVIFSLSNFEPKQPVHRVWKLVLRV